MPLCNAHIAQTVHFRAYARIYFKHSARKAACCKYTLVRNDNVPSSAAVFDPPFSHPFGDDIHAKASGQRYNGGGNRGILRIHDHIAHERAVNLHVRNRQMLQHR